MADVPGGKFPLKKYVCLVAFLAAGTIAGCTGIAVAAHGWFP